jgi:23S rRNA G2445 N2-methylase RlmL
MIALIGPIALSIALAAPTRYFASCAGGIEEILAQELSSARIGATDVETGRLGVHFSGPPEVGM